MRFDWRVLVLLKSVRYGYIVHLSSFQPQKIVCREVILENKLETPEVFQANRLI